MSAPLPIWAPFPGPLGGVTISAQRLRGWLERRGRFAGAVDLHDRVALLRSMARPPTGPHLFWASTAAAVDRHLLLARRASGTRWLFVHGGDIPDPRPLSARQSRVFGRVFATNTPLVDHLEERGFPDVRLASAHIPLDEPRNTPAGHDKVVIAVGHHRPWYGLDLAVASMEGYREAHPDASLTVLDYAGVDDLGRLPEWVDVRRGVGPDQVASVLAVHDVLVRPTTTDGDALAVREALDLGLKVVATDVVPRPAEVRLAAPSADEFLQAMTIGDRVSDGAGLGPSITQYLEGMG